MAQLAEFGKYEGLGNDFIVVDAPNADSLSPGQVKKLCDRHFGIGADGVLLVTEAPNQRPRMAVINADGSRPEMCGNGLRCVALHLALQVGASSAEYAIETDAGPLVCQVERDGSTAVVRSTLGVGHAVGEHRAFYEGEELRFDRVSMGNPHAILFEARQDVDYVDRVGSAVSGALGGSNVEFVRKVSGRVFDVVVWERGVGRTLACGTGAAAVAVALAQSQRASFDEPLEIRLPGGSLDVTVRAESLEVFVRGPARFVFRGRLATSG